MILFRPTVSEPVVHARGKIRPFTFERPVTVAAAKGALARRRRARVMAGGIDLINEMKCGVEIPHVVAIGGIAEMRGIALAGDHLVIGAATTHAEIERDRRVTDAFPSLRAILWEIGNVRVRAAGTIGGNLMARHRSYDWLPLLMALDAELRFADRPQRWYSTGVLASASGEWKRVDRLLTAIRIPLWGRPRLRFERDLKPAFSVAVCVRRREGDDVARVAIGGMHRAPVVRSAEDVRLAPRPPSITPIAELVGGAIAAQLPAPHDDGLVNAAYRRAVAPAVIVRTLGRTLTA